ncbi:hypothetical protein BKA62DRAFT_833891 [Auriculariales sp. MPI-PUGE-AT-0066]|nr:hypothetical protein BKA62DRAFT_833891 [Auriculariales sp. MPI-PUGE-AT-0066]
MHSRFYTALFVLLAFVAFALAKPVPANIVVARHNHGLEGILEIVTDLKGKILVIIDIIVALGVKADVSVHINDIVVCVNASIKAIIGVFLAGGIDLSDIVTLKAIAVVVADIIIALQACVGVIAQIGANVQACISLDLALKVLCLTLKVHAAVAVDVIAKLTVVVDAGANIVLTSVLGVLGVVV